MVQKLADMKATILAALTVIVQVTMMVLMMVRGYTAERLVDLWVSISALAMAF
jgi:hypothetical protein